MTSANPQSASSPGALRLFRLAGVDVFLHWSWAIVALIEIQFRGGAYESQFWNAAEYLTLFFIVLLHEFGHALACRSVGGQANRILLWPFGGIAFVNPPRRPGAVLWSIAAGPLVNVALIPITIGAVVAANAMLPSAPKDFFHYLDMAATINIVLLVFNMLPIYPLDGGQILQAILWFFIGLPRSLTVAAVIGLLGAAAVIVLAALRTDAWLILLALLGASRSLQGLKQAKTLARMFALPRHAGQRCPSCREAPPIGVFWKCTCGVGFDTFARARICPGCGGVHELTGCPFCGATSPALAWIA